MFHFQKLEVMHWDFWQRFSLPLEAQIVTIIGPNGSGKTTLLDGLRTLLALKCSGKRDYKRYVRNAKEPVAWLRGVVDNERSSTGRYPFFPLIDTTITLACRIRKQGGDWVRQYAIHEGDVAIEEIEARGVWIGVNDYRRRLESAGLTPAIAEVLALEQGDTDKLCEYSPRALLDLVFHVFGEKEILDNYSQAKQEQREAERELKELERTLEALNHRVESMIGRANRYIEWQTLQRERVKLEQEVLPRLELFELQDAIMHARRQQIGNRRTLREKQLALEDLQTRQVENQAALEQAGPNLVKCRIRQSDANTGFMKIREEIRTLEAKLNERQRLQEIAAAEGSDIAAQAEELAQLRQQLADIKSEIRQRDYRIDELNTLVKALKGGQPPAQPFVEQFRAALDSAGIRHEMLTDIVEVSDPGWQGAVEAILAPYRHIVLLKKPSDRAAAWALGEKLKYRHFVVADRSDTPRADKGSLLEVVRFSADAPDWLTRQLNRVQRVEDASEGATLGNDQEWITREGFYRERRGGRYIGVAAHDYHFGEGARRSRRIAAEEEIDRIGAEIELYKRKQEPITQRITVLQAKVAGVDAANMLAARADEFRLAGEQLEQLKANALKASDEVIASNQAFDAAQEAKSRLDARATELNYKIQQQQTDSLRIKAGNDSYRREQIERLEALRARRSALPPALWQNRAELRALKAEYESVGVVRREMARFDERLEREDWETDENVLILRDKLREEHTQMAFQTSARQREFDRVMELCDEARGAYISVLRNTVRRYGKNIRALGELAGIEVHVEAPHLENDDTILAQAGLTVQFNFDSKGLMGLNDGEASGGQQVMKSLILLIGLMMDEARPGGFVFIDEPFAHLDVFNIDKVSSFLKSTQAQYLITSPTTHNVNVFEPSELTLVTRKKQPGESWAQPIMVAVRDKSVPNPHLKQPIAKY